MRIETVQAGAVAAGTAGVIAPPGADARRWHYREFYGLSDGDPSAGLVLANCQGESLRIVLDEAAGATVRVPPVHEMTPDDMPYLERRLRSARFVVTQPIRDDYRGLPLGTRQVRDRTGGRMITVPNVRFAGMHPFQAALRVPGVDEDPPLVAYHDVRVLAAAAGERLPDTIGEAQVRAIAADSISELRARERAGATDVVASDLFDRPAFDLMRTVNHAGNPIWRAVGERVLRALGTDAAPTDPRRPLLASVQAPREAWVARAWGIDDREEPRWRVDGAWVDPDEVRTVHADWYRRHPAFVGPALVRLASTLAPWRSRS